MTPIHSAKAIVAILACTFSAITLAESGTTGIIGIACPTEGKLVAVMAEAATDTNKAIGFAIGQGCEIVEGGTRVQTIRKRNRMTLVDIEGAGRLWMASDIIKTR